jgi:hypothetical protein
MLSKSIFGGRSLRRRLAGCAATLGAAALVTGLAGPPAMAAAGSAQSTSHAAASGWGQIVYIYNVQTQNCLDSNGAGNAYALRCNGGNYQNWYELVTTGFPIPPGGLHTGTLKDAQTGRCLDSNYAGNVYTSPCDGNNSYESWTMYENGQWGAQFQDWQTGRCLDTNSAGNLYTSPCNYNNTYQNWIPAL